MRYLVFSITQLCDSCGEEMKLDAGQTPTSSTEVYVVCVNKKCHEQWQKKIADWTILMKDTEPPLEH